MTEIDWGEELPQPPRRELPGSPRVRAAVAAALLAVGVVGFALAHRGSDHRPGVAAARSTGARPSPARTLHPVAVPAALAPPRACRGGQGDLGTSNCETSTAIPGAFTAAVRARFPAAAAISYRAELLHHREPLDRSGLWSRQYAARLGGAGRVVVWVGRGAAPEQPSVVLHGHGPARVYARRVVRDFTVQVEVTGSPGRTPPAAAAFALAGDVRVVTSG